MDIYDYRQEPDGGWIVTKNGDFFISCSSEQAAKQVTELLRKDAGGDDKERNGTGAD